MKVPPEPIDRSKIGDSLMMQLPVLTMALDLSRLDTIDITAPDDPQDTVLLVGDRQHGKWRAITLPPGTVWKLEMRRRKNLRPMPLHQ